MMNQQVNIVNETEAEEEVPSRRLMASAAAVAKRNAPMEKWPTAIYSVDISQAGRRLPDTLLATSHEYNRIYDYGEEYIHAWANVFGKLSSSPIIRVGGASQDKMKKVPGPRVWKALKALQERVNARYIFGLPLWQKNAVELSKEIMALAEKHLAPGAVIGYELGNEPEFWPTGLGGRNEKGEWRGGFDAFATYFHRVAQQLAPCGSGKRVLSGPGWGNVNTQPHNWLARIMWTGKKCGYMWEVNVHYYPYIDNTTVSAEELLSQSLQDVGLDKYREYQRLADQGGMRLRISEMNSLYGGGRAGLSETAAGMFWVLDALCELAKAGAGGCHLHWGIGGAPDGTMGQPNTGVQTNFFYKVGDKRLEYKQLKEQRISVASLAEPVAWPSIHAPWYAYLAWTSFAHGGYKKLADATFINAKLDKAQFCKANTKIHALKADNGDLRIMLLNKHAKADCNARIKVPAQYCKTSELTRLLPGPQGMQSKGGISWQGQTYDNAGHDGEIQGEKVVQMVQRRSFKDGRCGFEIALPATTAALIVSKA
ncbi:hypothetical protein OEZ86_013470 [Tetradesmus obliquus]|nr:hypothetical protein OEZ86_013470 [Tetradesmus obliquus]